MRVCPAIITALSLMASACPGIALAAGGNPWAAPGPATGDGTGTPGTSQSAPENYAPLPGRGNAGTGAPARPLTRGLVVPQARPAAPAAPRQTGIYENWRPAPGSARPGYGGFYGYSPGYGRLPYVNSPGLIPGYSGWGYGLQPGYGAPVVPGAGYPPGGYYGGYGGLPGAYGYGTPWPYGAGMMPGVPGMW